MTEIPQPVAPTSIYTAVYDAWNRLVSLTAGATIVGQYAYDGANRRTTTVISETTRRFYYSPTWQVLEERLGTATTADRQFVLGRRYIDDVFLRDRGNERLYIQQDPNWNTGSICDPAGACQERYCYSAYGQPSFFTLDRHHRGRQQKMMMAAQLMMSTTATSAGQAAGRRKALGRS